MPFPPDERSRNRSRESREVTANLQHGMDFLAGFPNFVKKMPPSFIANLGYSCSHQQTSFRAEPAGFSLPSGASVATDAGRRSRGISLGCRRCLASDSHTGFFESYVIAASVYTPNTSRSASQISPSVAYAFTAPVR